MKTVVVTGSSGFIGKNLTAALDQDEGITILHYNKINDFEELDDFIKRSDFIYHLAGVNRPNDDSEFDQINRGLTERIIDGIEKSGRKIPILITSSTQAGLDNAYGKSKKAAEEALISWSKKNNSNAYIYRLPGVFGKWSRPNYNSVVATFCNNIAKGLDIQINDSKTEITLVYIDEVVDEFIKVLKSEDNDTNTEFRTIPRVFSVNIKELADRINSLQNNRTSLIMPSLHDDLNRFLYATLTSYYEKNDFSYQLQINSDDRGWLAEFIKSESFGQIFISKTKPGISRGNHWHKTKIEKFLVISGEGEIKFRLFGKDNEIIRYKVSGDSPTVLDIPAGYIHSIKNIGSKELITIFWADEILNKNNTDTYYESVEIVKE
jgi:UDP-2-acetamido-2,6-beta-L-arabino-hexul-4-ose reductase